MIRLNELTSKTSFYGTVKDLAGEILIIEDHIAGEIKFFNIIKDNKILSQDKVWSKFKQGDSIVVYDGEFVKITT